MHPRKSSWLIWICRLGTREIIGALVQCKGALVIGKNSFFFPFFRPQVQVFTLAADSDRAVSFMHCRSYLDPIGSVLHLAKVEDERVLHMRLQFQIPKIISDFHAVFHASIKESTVFSRWNVLVSEADVPRCCGPLPPIIHYPRSEFASILTELTEMSVHIYWHSSVYSSSLYVCVYFDLLQGKFNQLKLVGDMIFRGAFMLNVLKKRGSIPPLHFDAWTTRHVAWWRCKLRLTMFRDSVIESCSNIFSLHVPAEARRFSE